MVKHGNQAKHGRPWIKDPRSLGVVLGDSEVSGVSGVSGISVVSGAYGGFRIWLLAMSRASFLMLRSFFCSDNARLL